MDEHTEAELIHALEAAIAPYIDEEREVTPTEIQHAVEGIIRQWMDQGSGDRDRYRVEASWNAVAGVMDITVRMRFDGPPG